MTAAAKRDIERFKAGEPLDHIIGFVDFLDCKILVDKNVLIPRFETEFWVEEVLRAPRSGARILDMFAGSGAIGIAIVRHIKDSRVVFAESEKEAVAQIKKNCVLNKIVKDRYEIIQSDIFSNIGGTFDYIFANPPYIPTKNRNKIQRSVINHEPHAALFGGEDGMDLIRRFLAATKNRLNENGKIYMEFDSPQKPAIATLLKKLKYKKWDFHRDQYGKWRYVVIQ